MAFPERIRKYWLEVSEGKCQYEVYSEENGFVECGSTDNPHVHHIIPEGVTKHKGGNPDDNVGMVVCDKHHTRNIGEEEHSEDFSFHPDMGYAYKSYGDWKNQKSHLESIKGKTLTRREFPSPFDETVKQHEYSTIRGERYHAGTEEIDRYYEQKMTDKAVRYNVVYEAKKPRVNRKIKHKPIPTNWEWSKGLFR